MTTNPSAAPTLVLRGLVILGMVAAVGAGVLGAVFIVEDERTSTDMWDGLGTFLGLLAVGGAAVVLLVLGALYFLLTRQPRAGLLGVAILAGLGLLGTVIFVIDQTVIFVTDQAVGNLSFVPWEVAAAYGVGSLLVLGLAVWGLASS